MNNSNIISVIGDTHDVPALEILLEKISNEIISLGDIVAVNTQEYFANHQLYSKCWKCYLNNNFENITQEEKEWFENINISSWQKQIELISTCKQKFTVCQGNSDLRMFSTFEKMREELENLRVRNKNFNFVDTISSTISNRTAFLFLPYRDESYSESELQVAIQNCVGTEHIFVIGHCPPYIEHKKTYYVHHYHALKYISNSLGNITYIHGHVHADATYLYARDYLPNVRIITPKAEDSLKGCGSNHHILNIDTTNGSITIIDSVTGNSLNFEKPSKEYLEDSDHWNKFEKE